MATEPPSIDAVRVLFSFIGGIGHFLPLAPLAHAAERAGHTVAVAGSGSQVEAVAAAGFTAIATSSPPAAGGSPIVRDLTPLVPLDPRASELEFAENFGARGARRHAAALPAIITDFGADLVVRDEADLGAQIAAEVCGVVSASVLVLAAGTLIRPELVGPHLHEIRAEHGLPPSPTDVRPEVVLSPFPPSLRSPDAMTAAVDLAFRSGPPVAVRPPASPPRVYVTLGTVFGTGSGDLLERLLAAVAALPAEVLLAVGRHLDPAEFGTQPAHVRIDRYVDQELVLAESDLVVSHGGSGTLLGALTHGLPQVLTPLGADQSHNAERAEALGFGRVVDAASASPEEIRRAVEDALADPTVRARAREVQHEINDLPDASEAVRMLAQHG